MKNEEDPSKKARADGESADETTYEAKLGDPPLEIGEHYLVKRGEDSWSKLFSSFFFWVF